MPLGTTAIIVEHKNKQFKDITHTAFDKKWYHLVKTPGEQKQIL